MDLLGRVVGVDVNRCPQIGCTFPQGRIAVIVEIAAIGLPVDHCAGHIQVSHAAFELVRRFVGVLNGEMGQAAISGRVPGHFFGQKIIAFARETHRRIRHLFRLNTRSRQGQNRLLDPDIVHAPEPMLTQILKHVQGLAKQLRADVD